LSNAFIVTGTAVEGEDCMTKKSETPLAAFWWPGLAFASMAKIMDEKAAAMVEGAVMANIELVNQFTSIALGRAAPMQAAQAVAAAAMRPALRRRAED
jgi:hypothetical protein